MLQIFPNLKLQFLTFKKIIIEKSESINDAFHNGK